MRKAFFLIFCLSLFAVEAQNGFTTYTTNLAIPGSVKIQKALLVDNSGIKWIGFQTVATGANGGLVKYDNSNWTFYNKNSTPSFPSNYVTSLAKDNNGNIWIGCDSGLVKFDGVTFTTYSTAQGLPIKFVNCVEVAGNQIYVGTNKGLSRFDGISFTNYNVVGATLPNDTIKCIKSETANLLWLGGRNHLVEFSINGPLLTNYLDHSILNNPGNINCIYIDSQNAKWLGTNNIGILRYSGSTFDNATSLYSIIGSIIPNTVMDLESGFHNGIIFKHQPGNFITPNVFSGLTELAPNSKVYQYYYPVATHTLGNLIEKDGTNIVGTPGIGTYSGAKMFYSFKEVNYTVPLGPLNADNFKNLDINHVNAGIANRGDMHWNILGNHYTNQKPGYEVPKGSGKHTNFTSALWIGGKDQANQLHGAAQGYRESGNDFWPGPLDTLNASADTLTSLEYDRIWKVSYADVNSFISAYNTGSIVATPDMLTWPAHGTGNKSRNLAPFVDHNSDGLYNPNDGDYPKIKGDQALYFIFNDKLGTHESTFNSMGIEVQGMAYAYGCPGIVNGHNELTYTTFYDYKIINRSANNYHDVYVSMMSDVDIGYYIDDYIGCNVSDNYAFGYNSDNNDLSSGNYQGYGNYIPAQGIKVLKGPFANVSDGIDNNNNGVVDELNEDCKLSKLIYFNTHSFDGSINFPTKDSAYYKYMEGIWYDGTPITCGGNGYGGSLGNTNWVYTGDPSSPGLNTEPTNTCGYWAESSVPGGNVMILSSGPFTLNAGQMQEVEYAFVTSFDSSSTTNSNLLSVAKLKTDMQKVTAFYNQVNKPNCLQAIDVGVTEVPKQTDFSLFPNPAQSIIKIASTINGTVKINYEVVDVLGKTVMASDHTGSDKFFININDLNSGIYFLRLQVNNSVVVKKFVKE